MKKLLCCLCLLIGLQGVSLAEEIKCKAYEVAFCERSDNGTWEDWGDWEETDLLVTIDEDRIQIHRPDESLLDSFDLIEDLGVRQGKEVWEESQFWQAVNQDGTRCIISLYRYGLSYGVGVQYSNLMIDFHIKML